MSDAYDLERIEKTKQIISNYENAILYLTTNPTESYKLDTGQSEQEVKRHNLKNMNESLEGLYNRLNMFELRCNLTPTVFTPGW